MHILRTLWHLQQGNDTHTRVAGKRGKHLQQVENKTKEIIPSKEAHTRHEICCNVLHAEIWKRRKKWRSNEEKGCN